MRERVSVSDGNRLLLMLFISVALHICLLVWKWKHDRDEALLVPPPDSSPIEISEAPPMAPPKTAEKGNMPTKKRVESKEKEIVETEDAKNKEEDPNARFLSDRTQKAQAQTKAKRVDDFAKTLGTGPKEKQASQEGIESETTLSESDRTGDEGTKVTKEKKDWRKLSLRDLSVTGDGGTSGASDDRLADVQEGGRTVLSTREFRYFSYYHRIKELLRQYWKPMVEMKLYHMYEKGKNVGDNELTTRLLVLLSEDGRIEKISRMATSGFDDIDDAAIDAFRKAGPFPNPPKGIIDDDGFVRIRWDFILTTEATPRIQFQTVGNGP